jgi:hypothetical protein
MWLSRCFSFAAQLSFSSAAVAAVLLRGRSDHLPDLDFDGASAFAGDDVDPVLASCDGGAVALRSLKGARAQRMRRPRVVFGVPSAATVILNVPYVVALMCNCQSARSNEIVVDLFSSIDIRARELIKSKYEAPIRTEKPGTEA